MWFLLSTFSCTEVRKVQPEDIEVDVDGMYQVVLVPTGHFTMGSDKYTTDEQPVHDVILEHSFWMMTTEVTQELYSSMIQKNPSFFNDCGLDCPVDKVSWLKSARFANWLSALEGLEECYQFLGRSSVTWESSFQCSGWRLPTEAEWSWAAQGAQKNTHKYSGSNELVEVAWYLGNSSHRSHPVCQKKQNRLGLCDMTGNVYEWVWDRPGEYSKKLEINPLGGTTGSHRIARGGAWNRYAQNQAIVLRKEFSYAFQSNDLGFRLVRTNLE